MKKSMHYALNKFGFDIVRTKSLNNDLAKHLSNVFASRNIECVIDVGANSGQYGAFLREVGYKGYIVSFEPVSSAFKVLKGHCDQDDKWLSYNYALGDKNEE